MDDLFNKKVFVFSYEELLMDLNEVLDEIAPSGKSKNDFTGGYIQQLKNSNQLVAYFGTKNGTKNRDTVKIAIQQDELDLFYMMLKAKIHEMKNKDTKTVFISMAERRIQKLKDNEDLI